MQPTIIATTHTPTTQHMAAAGLINNIACALVDNENGVTVTLVGTAEQPVVEIRTAQTDIGKIIGKQGRTARSIRTILSGFSMKAKQRIALNIVEE